MNAGANKETSSHIRIILGNCIKKSTRSIGNLDSTNTHIQ